MQTKRKRVGPLGAITMVAVGLAACVIEPVGSLPEMDAEANVPENFEDYIENNLANWSVPGAAIVVFDEQNIQFARGFGVIQSGGDDPVTPDTSFGVASVTKTQIAAGIAALVSDGDLTFDDRVQDHLLGFELKDPTAASTLTIRDLLTHRSGIETYGDWIEEVPNLSANTAIQRSHLLPLTFGVREQHSYNNYNFVLLGEIIEQVTGQSWEDYLKQRVWSPLGSNTAYGSPKLFTIDGAVLPTADGWLDDVPMGRDAIASPTNVALPHAKWPSAFENQIFFEQHELENGLIHYHGSAIDASQSAFMSVLDLARHGQMLLNNGQSTSGDRVLNKEVTTELSKVTGFEPYIQLVEALDPAKRELLPIGYSLGHELYVFGGNALIGHGGDELGSAAIWVIDPVRKLGVAAAINNRLYTQYEMEWMIEPILAHWYGFNVDYTLSDQYLKLEAQLSEEAIEASANSLPRSEIFQEYATKLIGEYRHPYAGGILIYLDGDELKLSRGLSYEYRLYQGAEEGQLIAIPQTPRRLATALSIEKTESQQITRVNFSEIGLSFDLFSRDASTERAKSSLWNPPS